MFLFYSVCVHSSIYLKSFTVDFSINLCIHKFDIHCSYNNHLIVLSPNPIPAVQSILSGKNKGGLSVGAAVTLTRMIDELEHKDRPKAYKQAARHLRRVANTQVGHRCGWMGIGSSSIVHCLHLLIYLSIYTHRCLFVYVPIVSLPT